MEFPGQRINAPGWCKEAVRDRVAEKLKKFLTPTSGPGRDTQEN